jgi:hypothetical protein
MKKHGAGGVQYGGAGRTSGKSGNADGDVKEKVAGAASEVRDRGEELLEEGREKVEELSHAAGEMARNRADQQLERVVDGIRIFADVLRQGGNDLSGDRRQYRGMLNTVAEQADGVTRYLQDRDVQSVTRDIRRFARDNTPLFLGGAFALGLLGARFLKRSGDEAHDDEDWRYREGGMQQRYDRMLPQDTARPSGGTGYGQGASGTGYGATTGTGSTPGAGPMPGYGASTTPGAGSTPGYGASTGTGSMPGAGSPPDTRPSGGTGSLTDPGSTGRTGDRDRMDSEPGSRGRS